MNAVFSKETAESVKSARRYRDGDAFDLPLGEPRFDHTEIAVEATDSVSATIAQSGNVALLDFASFMHPGGGYEGGAWAQEEAICSETNLYNILVEFKDSFYMPHRSETRGGLYTSDALYVRDVKFVRNGNITSANVIVIAAPNAGTARKNHRDEVEIDADMRRRIGSIMNIAADNGIDTLICGAFGCGVFKNDPYKVAKDFKEWIAAHDGMFEKVVFAIPQSKHSNNYEAFIDVFSSDEDAIVATVDDGDADDERNDDGGIES